MVVLVPLKVRAPMWAVMFLNAGQEIEGWAGGVAFRLQAHAHDAPEHKGQEADQRMGADAVWQAVVDLGDLDVGFQDAETALDIGHPNFDSSGADIGDRPLSDFVSSMG